MEREICFGVKSWRLSLNDLTVPTLKSPLLCGRKSRKLINNSTQRHIERFNQGNKEKLINEKICPMLHKKQLCHLKFSTEVTNNMSTTYGLQWLWRPLWTKYHLSKNIPRGGKKRGKENLLVTFLEIRIMSLYKYRCYFCYFRHFSGLVSWIWLILILTRQVFPDLLEMRQNYSLGFKFL